MPHHSQVRRRGIAVVAAALALPTCLSVALTAPADSVVRTETVSYPALAQGKVLVLDNHRIEATRAMKRRYLQAAKVQLGEAEPGRIIVRRVGSYAGLPPQHDDSDSDVDSDQSMQFTVNTVMRDVVDGKPLWRMWLRSGINTGYRESQDGINWHIHDEDSVVVLPRVINVSVFKDSSTGTFRLLGTAFDQITRNGKTYRPYVEYTSTDGIDWHKVALPASVTTQPGDIISGAYDAQTGRYLMVSKQSTLPPTPCAEPDTSAGGRTFYMSTTRVPAAGAPARWSRPSRPFRADCVDASSTPRVRGITARVQFYGVPFIRFGDQFLGTPWVFTITRPAPDPQHSGNVDGPIDSQIASNPNPMAQPWTRRTAERLPNGRMGRPPLINRGVRGAWDDGMIYANSLVPDSNGDVRVYYSGYDDMHEPNSAKRAGTGLAVVRHGRFASLGTTGTRSGWTRTRPFVFHNTASGSRDLRVDAATSAGGTLRVKVVDARTGKAIPGYGFAQSIVVRSDQTSQVIRWSRKRLGTLSGRPVKLIFAMSKARLYGFTVSAH